MLDYCVYMFVIFIYVGQINMKCETSYHAVDGDPEFIVKVVGIERPLCFKSEGKDGQIIRLVQDRQTGITVNARLVASNSTENNPTFLGTISILRKNIIMIIKPYSIVVNRQRFQWDNLTAFMIRGHRVVIGSNLIAVTFRRINVTAIIRRHHLPSTNQLFSYLGFYLSDIRGFSEYTHGLLGQFLFKTVEIENLRYRNNRAKARLSVTSPLNPIPRRAVATLGSKINLALNVSTLCWVLKKGGRGVVDGSYNDYVVSSMRDSSLINI